MEVAARLRVCIGGQNLRPEDLYDAIATEGSMDKQDIRNFLDANNCDIEQEKLDLIFAPSEPNKDGAKKSSDKAEDKDGKEGKKDETALQKVDEGQPLKRVKGPIISKEDFLRAIRIFYKVIKEIVLSDNLLIEQSRQIRRMEVGEVMEVQQGPMLDSGVGVYRVQGKALRDGVQGWVTVAGNQGVTFLLPGGNVFQVVKPTPLTEDLKDTEGTCTVKPLEEGQVLEVLEWARTSRSALGVTRIKVRVQGDDTAVGWATVNDKDGNTYLEAC